MTTEIQNRHDELLEAAQIADERRRRDPTGPNVEAYHDASIAYVVFCAEHGFKIQSLDNAQ